MCVTCGCASDGTQFFALTPRPVESGRRVLAVERSLLAENDRQASVNRQAFDARRITAFNLLSSPGSGKTTLLVNSVTALSERCPVVVIEGDQQTDRDAQRIRATGVPAVQINTGKGCHLDAQMVNRALAELALVDDGVVFIENVGNLVCPAEFDLGEHAKVVILSVTEGDDKPLKYENMFHAADVVVLNKVDLLPYVAFDVALCRQYIARINPRAEILLVSATRGDGIAEWLRWIEQRRNANIATPREVAAPAQRT